MRKTSTRDHLSKEGFNSDNFLNICILRGKKLEAIDHLFIPCEVAYFIWGYLLKHCVPRSLGELMDAWKVALFMFAVWLFGKNGMKGSSRTR